MRGLFVWFADVLVGHIELLGGEEFNFRYEPQWLTRTGAFALCEVLPLTDETFTLAARIYFGNLLPEGLARQAVCARLGISFGNDFALLAALGRDCAGCISIVAEPNPPARANKLKHLPKSDLTKFLHGASAYAAALEEDVRLSLAGAQDKLAVIVRNDQLFLPLDGSPSTHLIKFQNRSFAWLPENEFFVTLLGNACGLDTVKVKPFVLEGEIHLLVDRYDRASDVDGIIRLHQQDFCQGLGLPYTRKYEGEGGPAFSGCVELVRRVSAHALADTRALLEWLAFCWIVGNRDNHAKNLSLVRSLDGQWRLSPFYDLVCTTAYPNLSRTLAFTIGGNSDGGNLPRSAWYGEAKRLGVSAPYFLKIVSEMRDKVKASLPRVADSVRERCPKTEAVDAVVRAVRKGVRAADRSLDVKHGP